MDSKRRSESFEFGERKGHPFPTQGKLFSPGGEPGGAFSFCSAEISPRRLQSPSGCRKFGLPGPACFCRCCPALENGWPDLKTPSYRPASNCLHMAGEIYSTPADAGCFGICSHHAAAPPPASARPTKFALSSSSAPERHGASLPATVQNKTLPPPQPH